MHFKLKKNAYTIVYCVCLEYAVLTGGRLDPPTVTVAEIEMRDTPTTQHTMASMSNNTQSTMTPMSKNTQATMASMSKNTQATMASMSKNTQATMASMPKNRRGNMSPSGKQGI